MQIGVSEMAFPLLMMIYLERSCRVFLRKLSSEVQNHHLHLKKKRGVGEGELTCTLWEDKKGK